MGWRVCFIQWLTVQAASTFCALSLKGGLCGNQFPISLPMTAPGPRPHFLIVTPSCSPFAYYARIGLGDQQLIAAVKQCHFQDYITGAYSFWLKYPLSSSWISSSGGSKLPCGEQLLAGVKISSQQPERKYSLLTTSCVSLEANPSDQVESWGDYNSHYPNPPPASLQLSNRHWVRTIQLSFLQIPDHSEAVS